MINRNNKSISCVVCLSLMLSFSIGCAPKGASLSAANEKTFKDTIKNLQNAQKISKGSSGGNGNDTSEVSAPLSEEEIQFNEMDRKIGAAVAAGTCLTSGNPGQSSFGISGTDCPVNASFNSSRSGDDFSLKLAYEIKDAGFKKYMDVDKYELTVSGKFALSESAMDLNVKMTGKVHSQKEGDVSFNGSIVGKGTQEEGGSAKFELTFKFPSFEAKLKGELSQTRGNEAKEKYTLNGKEISKNEAKKIFDMMNPMENR